VTVSNRGDVNGDGVLDLKDGMLVLKIMSGIGPTEGVTLDADVNGDGKIGMAEAIYILQKVGGLR
jgi:hypothetical protein